MVNDTADTSTTDLNTASPELLNNPASSPAQSDAKSEQAQVKHLLAEARSTRDVLVGFRAAIETGTFHGGKMLDIAKGLAFLEAILNQNQAHIHNLQERSEVK